MREASEKWNRARLGVLEGAHQRVFKRPIGFIYNAYCALVILFAAGYARFNFFAFPPIDASVATKIQVAVTGAAKFGCMLLLIMALPIGYLDQRFRREIKRGEGGSR